MSLFLALLNTVPPAIVVVPFKWAIFSRSSYVNWVEKLVVQFILDAINCLDSRTVCSSSLSYSPVELSYEVSVFLMASIQSSMNLIEHSFLAVLPSNVTVLIDEGMPVILVYVADAGLYTGTYSPFSPSTKIGSLFSSNACVGTLVAVVFQNSRLVQDALCITKELILDSEIELSALLTVVVAGKTRLVNVLPEGAF